MHGPYAFINGNHSVLNQISYPKTYRLPHLHKIYHNILFGVRMKSKMLTVFLILSVILSGCAEKSPSCREIFTELLSVCGEDFDRNGEIYYLSAAEGELGYISDEKLNNLYGESSAERIRACITDGAVFAGARAPCELALFECTSKTATRSVERYLLERADTLRVALRGSAWQKKSESITVTVCDAYVVFIFTERVNAVDKKLKNIC